MNIRVNFRSIIFAIWVLFGIKTSAQCNFTGLNSNYCTNSATSALVPGITGGSFSGPGITGSTFNPALAGPGTHTISYNVCQTSYSVSLGVFSPLSTVGNTLGLGSFSAAGAVNNDDGTSAALPIGFNFDFFCNTYNTFYICTNGFITFNVGQTSTYMTVSLPAGAPVNFIAFPWTDLNLNYGGTITYTTVGAAPNRKLLVSFISVAHYNATNGGYPVTIQLILYETTNVIEIHTTTMPIPPSLDNAVMGIQNASTTYTIVTGRNNTNNWSATNECYRFIPGTSCATSQTTNVSPTSISVAGNNSICVGATTTLTATGNNTYTWSTSSNSNSVVVTPSSTQTYTVSGTNSFGCVASSAITVTVDNTPTVSIVTSNGNTGVCPGQTISLSGSGASGYSWAGGPVPISNGASFTIASTTSYTLTGTNACGISTAAISVSIHPLPNVVPVASSSSLCSGGTLTLTGTGNSVGTYTWAGGSVPVNNGVGFIPPSTSVYTVIGASALNCTAAANVQVTVVPVPLIAPVASPSLVCIGGSSTLSAVGATSYTWTSGTQTVFTPNFTVTPSSPGISTYTISKSNSNCVDTKTISVVTNSLPSILAIANPQQICALQPATLSVGGGQSYTWTAPGTPTFSFNGATPIVYPTSSSVYTVAASDGTCISITTVSLTVDPNPTITISPSSPSICAGQSVNLSASGGNSYTWTSSSGGTFNTPSFNDTPGTTISYSVTGDNSTGCTTTTTQIILVYQSPTINIVSSKNLVCSGDASTLTANGAVSYTWDANAGNATTSVVVVNPTNTVSGPVTYSVTGTNALGCPTTNVTQVNVYVPVLSISGNTNTCIGGQIHLSASGTNANGFNWNTGSANYPGTNLNTTVSAAGIYTVSANSSSTSVTCPASQTVAVGVYSNPTITAVAQRTTICKNEQVDLQAGGGVSYSWSNAMNGGTITVSPQSNTTYTVTGTDANQCVGTGTVQVKVSGCNGIEELSKDNAFFIYPNPNKGEFIIQADAALHLMLTNELGQPVRNIDVSSTGNYQAYITNLAEGVYFLSGQKDKVLISQRIVVMK